MKSTHFSLPNVKHLLGVAWALVLAFLFVLAIDSFVTTPGGDSSIYTYVAKGMLQGEIPYLDRWENKGPLFYVLNLFGLVHSRNLGDLGRSGPLLAWNGRLLPFCCFGGAWASSPRCSLSRFSSPTTDRLRRQATIRSSTAFSFSFSPFTYSSAAKTQATHETFPISLFLVAFRNWRARSCLFSS